MFKYFVFLLIMSFTLVGCVNNASFTVNRQRSAIRSSTDIGTTVLLDNADTALKAEAYALKSAEIAQQVITFLDTGNVGSLTTGALNERLLNIAKGYEPVAALIMVSISGYSVNTDVVGDNNIKRIKAACIGIIQGAEQYKLEDRQ